MGFLVFHLQHIPLVLYYTAGEFSANRRSVPDVNSAPKLHHAGEGAFAAERVTWSFSLFEAVDHSCSLGSLAGNRSISTAPPRFFWTIASASLTS